MGGSEISEPDKAEEDKAPETEGKIQRSLKSMFKQMQLSDNEMKYRLENFDNVDVVKEYLKYLKCTKCNTNFQQVVKKGDSVGVHPLLGVLMCDSCCDYYGDGNFSLDSEGEDKYCRWCGEGGTIFVCSKCICGFCDVCIRKHFGEKGIEAVKNDDDWICYFCNPEPLWYLRSICSLAKEAARNRKENLKMQKGGTNVRKKRRKMGSAENDLSKASSEDSSISSSSSNSSGFMNKRKSKRRRLLRFSKKGRRGTSSSSEDEKENHVNSKKRASRSKKQSRGRVENKESSESDIQSPKKKSKNCSEETEFEGKITLILQKLKSIWRLTQTITEVGYSSSRDKLKSLASSRCYTVERLKKEHEVLKSCMDVLVSSLNTASNSVNSIKEDLTFDTTKDETESFRSQEIKLKTFAEKFHEESDDHTSVDSKGGSFRKRLKDKEGRIKQPARVTRKSVKEAVKKKKLESDKNLGEGNSENKSISLFSDSGSDEEKNKQNSGEKEEKQNEDEESADLEKQSDLLKPLLKVKSFAKMLHENVYDQCKGQGKETPVVIDLLDGGTDESENESKNTGTRSEDGNTVEGPSSEVNKKSSGEDLNKKEYCVTVKADRTPHKEKDVSINDSDTLDKSAEDEIKNKKSSVYSTRGDKRRRRRENKQKGKVHTSSDHDSTTERKENTTGKQGKDEKTKKDDVENKKRVTTEAEKEEKSSGNAEPNSSDNEMEQHRGKKSCDKKTGEQLADDENQKSEETTETEGEKEKQCDMIKEKVDENRDKKELSEEAKGNDKNSDSDTSTTVDDDDDDNGKEKAMEKSVEDENEKSDGRSENTDDENTKNKEDTQNSSGNESESKKNSSSTESKAKKKSERKSKERANDSESKSSSDDETNTIKLRKKKKEVNISFEKFKRKRERFLKTSKENCQSEGEKEVNVAKALESSESEGEKKETVKKSGRPKKKRILASSDEETGVRAEEMSSSEESEKENNNQESEEEEAKVSTGGESSSEEEVKTKKRGRIKKRQKGSSDSSEEEKKRKKKRRESSSESSGDEKTKKKKKGRKNIKKILKKDSLQVETKEALKNEEDRKKRLKERQKLFEEVFPLEEEDGVPKRLVLDFDSETKEPLVTVHKKLLKKLKPHQVKGVKFMWDSCFESVQKLEEESGSGCILAHCMGLGKTLQVVTLVHTVMTHDLGVNTVLIVSPLSTVSNWIREFETWLGSIHTEPITLYDLVRYKRRDERLFHLKDWHENGGVLVLSYDLFRNLTKTPGGKKEKKKKPKYQQIFEKTLLDPGPDLVVCDEGHLLKNEDTALSKCMNRVKTSRRIILTGTPLQNNLVEYHCMVQFVKPNILGTRKEFCNRFVNPINNGQFEDSTELDVKIMKRRSHVLHSMLDGCIQRFDYSVLTPFLPEKHEYVLSIALTETQEKVYMHFISNLSAKSTGSSRAASLFNDYHSLQRIWTHPRAMLMQTERETQKDLDRDSEGSLKDFVVSSSEESERSGSESSDGSVEEVAPRKRLLRSNANDPDVLKAIEEEEKVQVKHWWDEFYDEKAYDDLRESNKLVLLFSLLKYCGQKNDKLLVFSQSLYSLDLIEYFLAKIDENSKKDNETLCGHRDRWVLGSDYFRLDGSTSSETRANWCKYFNKESNTRARLFLISTRAGGLGINLYGANRVIIFDASWNPSHDLQSIFRVYRFGQKKTCYIYRFLSEATMEEKIYERQVTKLSLAHRVVDEHQIERHYTMGNLQELYAFQPTPKNERKVPNLPTDPVLADILAEHKEIIVGYHEHDSLLENKQEEELSEEERKAAWKEYEEEKAQKTFNFNMGMEQQFMMMQQAQFVQGGMGMQQILNPAATINTSQNFINPMFVPTNAGFPLETLQRGVRVGVTPLPNESFDSYVIRILNREAWLQGKQTQGQ